MFSIWLKLTIRWLGDSKPYFRAPTTSVVRSLTDMPVIFELRAYHEPRYCGLDGVKSTYLTYEARESLLVRNLMNFMTSSGFLEVLAPLYGSVTRFSLLLLLY